MTAGARQVEVDPERLARWVVSFAARHGGLVGMSCDDTGFTMDAADGAQAVVRVPFPPWRPPARMSADGDQTEDDDQRARADALAASAVTHAGAPREVAVLIVRRGGYACALVRAGVVAASKVGSRYVQGRTAAGGQSQQRFARRRDKQVAELVGAAADTAARVLLPVPPGAWLVAGGDAPLVGRVLADRRLAALAAAPRGLPLAVGDPGRDLVADLPRRLVAVQIVIQDAAAGRAPGHPGPR